MSTPAEVSPEKVVVEWKRQKKSRRRTKRITGRKRVGGDESILFFHLKFISHSQNVPSVPCQATKLSLQQPATMNRFYPSQLNLISHTQNDLSLLPQVMHAPIGRMQQWVGYVCSWNRNNAAMGATGHASLSK
jgi:hypothetical protein